ncbi:hypothetical protein DRO26_00680 [Candidatus Bathyarchaeota archaeon]|nr:MAG: hypothetical protein DRO26_00680 [Candidatus Bathyarchaeota archaeon]
MNYSNIKPSTTSFEVKVKIAASEILGEHIIPCLVSGFKISNPKIDFSLQIYNSSDTVRMVKEGVVDIAAVQLPKKLKHYIEKFEHLMIAEDRLVVISAVEYGIPTGRSITVKELTKHPLVLSEEKTDLNHFVRHLFSIHRIDHRQLKVKLRLFGTSAIITSVS